MKHIKKIDQLNENNKINESILIKDKLDKIERIKREYGSESNQYIIIALNEIIDIIKNYFKIDEN